MIVILRPGAQKARVEALMSQIKQRGVDIHYSQGATETILGLVGDTTHVDEDWLRQRHRRGCAARFRTVQAGKSPLPSQGYACEHLRARTA